MNKREYIDNILKEAKAYTKLTFKTRVGTFDIIMKLCNAVQGLHEELDSMQNLLEVAQCPNCDGSGTIVNTIEGYETGCCGNPHGNGECCGDPIPIETQTPELQQCQWCYEVGELK